MKEFDFDEFEKFVKNWNEVYKDLEKWLKTFLLQQAQRVVANARRRTPVDTGALRASWGIGTQQLALKSSMDSSGHTTVSLDTENSSIADISVVGNNLEVTIWNGMEYASFIEFGHTTNGGGWYDGHFMLTISIQEVENAMPGRFHKQFKEWLKSKGAV